MPPWGRPPGGRPASKNERQWQAQQRSWNYDARVEELDTDYDDSGQGYGRDRFVSDELRFTGVDLGGGDFRRRRSVAAYDDDFTPSDDEDVYEVSTGLPGQAGMQVVYRNKEEMLVQRALERIARARALGKPNVKLSRAEIDALARAERNQTPPLPSPLPSAAPKAAPRGKKEAAVRRKPVEARKKSSRNEDKSASNSPKGKTVDARNRGSSSASSSSGRDRRDDSAAAYRGRSADPGFFRQPPYPSGYYITGPRQADAFRQSSRASSSQSLRQQPAEQLAMYHQPYYSSRYASNPEAIYSLGSGSDSTSARAARPDPSEADWEPRSRSASSLVDVPIGQLPYQTNIARAPRFDPSDPRFASPQRRVASGPPNVLRNQAAQYRRPQDELFLPGNEVQEPEVMRYQVPSDSEEEEDDDDDDNDDSDYEQGAQVTVNETPRGGYSIQTRSAAASTSARKTGSSGKSAARTKKGR
ncbi:hypothetical protein PV11_09395 [Exophiala sideris]|uniref:Uncharacterized protein n=1 Tax=Exophiala sideris TaxID=1016849 RepID=A0A0D1WRA0_9EURO|nr:hypothetical protein PV11_09395 [Exophiala sideris]